MYLHFRSVNLHVSGSHLSDPAAESAAVATERRGSLAGVIAPDGTIGGRYRLGPRIGAGGMATIFRAHDPVLERDVAVKVVHAHLADDPRLVDRFRHEARHAASLDHPNVVHVYDAGVQDLPYIVMELIEGPSLRQVLSDQGPLRPGQAVTILEPVSRALARAHSRGIVHRDVKPENILLAGDGRAKIADFGIARTVAATSSTRAGQLVGTVHYLAPELVDGREASAASDQYAVGVVLFEILTGRKALPADSPAAVALRHARETVPPPSAYVTNVGRALDRVVARATARKPSDRYPDLTAFADALRQAVPAGPEPVAVAAGPSGDTLVVDRDALPTATVAAVDDITSRRPAGAPVRSRLARLVPRRRATPRRRADRAHRRLRPFAVVITVALLAALAAAGLWHFVVAPVRTVPDLSGVPEDVAIAELADLGLSLEVTDRQFDLEVPEGAVLSQTPAPASALRSGGVVEATVSRGLDTTEVPDITGRTVEEAAAALEESTLGEVKVADEIYHDAVPAGAIVSQDPEPGAVVDQLTDVQVVVSRGIEQVEVPEVVGAMAEDAEAALADAKLAVESSTTYSDEVPTAGEVISQSVEAGSTVDKGTVVELVVSRGPLTIEMPDVRTQPIDDAVAELESLGLDVTVDEEPVPTIGPFRRGTVGRAEEQLPQAGASVERGAQVVLYTFVDG